MIFPQTTTLVVLALAFFSTIVYVLISFTNVYRPLSNQDQTQWQEQPKDVRHRVASTTPSSSTILLTATTPSTTTPPLPIANQTQLKRGITRLLLLGDFNPGGAIDYIHKHHNPTHLDGILKDVRTRLHLAEAQLGEPIPRNVEPSYIWGDSLPIIQGLKPDITIINLESAITSAETPWGLLTVKSKLRHRCHQRNVEILKVGGVDIATLANNHMLDYNTTGLIETMETLEAAGIGYTGAGFTADEAWRPVIRPLPNGGRLIVFSAVDWRSGVPWASWNATEDSPGLSVLPRETFECSGYSRRCDCDCVKEFMKMKFAFDKKEGDIKLLSIHWDINWSWRIGRPMMRELAHYLIDELQFDVIHGHSSHHVKGIEIYKGKVVIYGAGDFIDDYEGFHTKFWVDHQEQLQSMNVSHDLAEQLIRRQSRYGNFRGDLGFLYILDVDSDGSQRLALVPKRTRAFRVENTNSEDTEFLLTTMNRESARFDLSFHEGYIGEVKVFVSQSTD